MTLTWNHTRKGTPMSRTGTYGFLMLQVMTVRSVFRIIRCFLNGQPV